MARARLLFMVVAAILIPACGGGGGGGGSTPATPEEQCLAHLQALYAAMQQYKTDNGAYPSDTGGNFWIRLSISGPPYVTDLSLYGCPVKAIAPPPGTTDYRGPASDANGYTPTQIIGADKVTNHGASAGGYVLLKNGTIQLVPSTDPLWFQASAETTN